MPKAFVPAGQPAAAKGGTAGKAHIVTFGCQMNERDSETLAGYLEQMGYGFTDDPEEADLILFNTCSVRENPERKVYGRVGELRRLKARRPHLVVGICGCMMQQPHEVERVRRELPHVDLIFGTMNIHRFPELLARVLATRAPVVEVWHEEGEVVEGLPVRRGDSLKAWVTVMYGCDKFCTYCIVPKTRGRERSRKPEDILAECSQLGREGYKEITLLGQNVNSYGHDLGTGIDFAGLLWMVNNRTPGIERIRFTTSHPWDVTDRLIDAIAHAGKVCEHLHLPVQAGSDRVLKRMGRRYTVADYLRLVERLRRACPEISLTTDIIVGFPGETDQDFAGTLRLVEEAEFDGAYTFIYSPRYGTPATRLKDPVPEAVARERIQRLIELQNGITRRKMEAMVGRTVEVLVEGRSKTDPGRLFGRTRTNKHVVFPGDAGALTGRLVDVRITAAQTWNLFGDLVGQSCPAEGRAMAV